MTRTAPEPGDRLDAIFSTVVEEARNNPNFADRLRQALGQKPAAKNRTPSQSSKTASTSAPPDIHAVNVLRQHGEKMLRGRLSNIRTKADLTQIARRSGLRLTGKAARKSASKPDLIDGIVEAAIQYDNQRESVEG